MITAEEAQRDQDELDRLALDKLIEDYRHTAHWLLRLQSHPAVVAPDAEVALTHVSNVFCQAILGYLP